MTKTKTIDRNDFDLHPIPPRILIIDHHDSYTHNLLICLLDALTNQYSSKASTNKDGQEARKKASKVLLSRTLILPFTHPIWQNGKESQLKLLKHFDALILGPGPGRPDVREDFGASLDILQLFINEPHFALPTLGICLGHQGIAIACGGKVKRAKNLRHGMISQLNVESNLNDLQWPSIFDEMETQAKMTTYNSLVVDESSLPFDEIRVTAWANDRPVESSSQTESDSEKVVMGVQHVERPLWGVQFHPESIASEGGGRILRNFLDRIYQFWGEQDAGLSKTLQREAREIKVGPLPEWIQSLSAMSTILPNRSFDMLPESLNKCPKMYKAVMHSLGKFQPSLAPVAFKSLFEDDDGESAVWLDSARPGGHQSRYSFMSRPSWSVRYDVNEKELSIRADGKECKQSSVAARQQDRNGVTQSYGLPTPELSRTNSPEMMHGQQDPHQRHQSFWNWLDNIQQNLQENSDLSNIESSIPFKTGFVGYLGYEMKYESLPTMSSKKGTLNLMQGERETGFPSSWFGFCDKVIVIDHFTKEWFVIGLVKEDEESVLDLHVFRTLQQIKAKIGCSRSQWTGWVNHVSKILGEMCEDQLKDVIIDRTLQPLRAEDTREEYMKKVENARQLISEGQSYELCLTTEFRGKNSENDPQSHFHLYTSLRARNPAPFSAFLRLDRINGEKQKSVLSTSPEKFIGIDAEGCVEMKPIKGTLARAGYGKGEKDYLKGIREGNQDCIRWCQEEDLKRVDRLQADIKERAENLMIVDLIRRDLLQFCLPESVQVTKLMQIESYETVHQLVTTVEGKKALKNSSNRDVDMKGSIGTVEAIQQCFPPGSMTGAPKLRSVQLLESLEHEKSQRNERGVYSGILGYLSLNGAANFNVIIRTICLNGQDVSVGAGGAITFHSKAEKEWQEVLDKVGAIAPTIID